ncbi:MAG: apolipoprotein N-acyltransferase [Cyanobacteria bacterium P01_D01_bin.36]
MRAHSKTTAQPLNNRLGEGANRLQRFKSVAGLLIGGVLMGLAPVDAWPLAWIAMIPLWGLLHQSRISTRSTIIGAAIWGVAYHGTALSWIVWWLKPLLWMGLPWVGGVAIAFFAWAFITAWGAAIGMTWMALMLAIDKWQPVSGWRRILVGTALWCAVEWLWSKGPLYWTSLSYTQSPHNLIGLQLGQLAGPITITAGLVAVNGLLAEALWSRRREKSSFSSLLSGPLLWGTLLFLGLHLAGFALYARPLADTPEKALNVGLIQGNIPTNEKLTAPGLQTSRQVYLDGYEALVNQGAELVITPEGSISQTWNSFTQDRDLFMRAVVKNGVPLILGTFAHVDIEKNTGPLTQSLLTLSPEEKVVGRYNKIKLVPLGEYIPFEKVVRAVLGPLLPWASLAPGDFSQQLNTPFGPVAAGICYESAFTTIFRQQVNRGGQLIFTASNNDPYPPRQMMQHHAQDVMRAIENDRWEVRVTNTGISGVVDPKGRSHWISEPGERIIHQHTVYRRNSQTLYVRMGDWLTPLLLISACYFAVANRSIATGGNTSANQNP